MLSEMKAILMMCLPCCSPRDASLQYEAKEYETKYRSPRPYGSHSRSYTHLFVFVLTMLTVFLRCFTRIVRLPAEGSPF